MDKSFIIKCAVFHKIRIVKMVVKMITLKLKGLMKAASSLKQKLKNVTDQKW